MAADSVWARTVSTSDYYPFGLEMQGRTWHDTTTYTIVRDTVQRISYEALTQCDFEDGDACGWTVEAGGTLTTEETADGGVMQFTVAACGEDCPGSISATKALTTESGQEYRITLALDLGDAERIILSVRGDGDDGDEELASVEYTQDNLPENGEASLFFTANGATSTLYVTHGSLAAVVDADVVIFDDVEVEQVVLTEAVELRAVDAYRYGFNGKEKDDNGEFGNTHYDYGFRIYNPSIGKFLSVDPLTKSYPMLTPYQFASNTPIAAIDLDGLESRTSIKGEFVDGHWTMGSDNHISLANEAELKMKSQQAANQKPVVFIPPSNGPTIGPAPQETPELKKYRENKYRAEQNWNNFIENGQAIDPFTFGGPGFGQGFARTTAEGLKQAPSVVLPELAFAKLAELRKTSIVYRVIRAEEDIAAGLLAKSPAATYSIEGHVLHGSRIETQFISTTTDINVATEWAAKTGNRIVEINLSKVQGQIFDLSTQAGREALLKGNAARNFAAKSSEVLLQGEVPAAAMKLVKTP